MSKYSKFANLVLSLLLSVVLIVALSFVLSHVEATTTDENYSIVLDSLDAPTYGRAAPYGQWLVTHNGVVISGTQDLGTVARTNGYDERKAIFCSAGTYDVTGYVYGRLTSAGDVYTLTGLITLPANNRTVITMTQVAPWMSLGLTSEMTGSTTTCGIYVQTP